MGIVYRLVKGSELTYEEGDGNFRYLNNLRNVADVDPTATDDSDSGFFVGAWWHNRVSGDIFECTDATVGAAVWEAKSFGGGGSLTAVEVTSGVYGYRLAELNYEAGRPTNELIFDFIVKKNVTNVGIYAPSDTGALVTSRVIALGEDIYTSAHDSLILGNNIAGTDTTYQHCNASVILGSGHTLNQTQYSVILGASHDLGEYSGYNYVNGEGNEIASNTQGCVVTGSDNFVTGANLYVTGCCNGVNGANCIVKGNEHQVYGNAHIVMGSQHTVASSSSGSNYNIISGEHNSTALDYMFLHGQYLIDGGLPNSMFIGKYNASIIGDGTGRYLRFGIGNGTSTSDRKNIFEISDLGYAVYPGNLAPSVFTHDNQVPNVGFVKDYIANHANPLDLRYSEYNKQMVLGWDPSGNFGWCTIDTTNNELTLVKAYPQFDSVLDTNQASGCILIFDTFNGAVLDSTYYAKYDSDYNTWEWKGTSTNLTLTDDIRLAILKLIREHPYCTIDQYDYNGVIISDTTKGTEYIGVGALDTVANSTLPDTIEPVYFAIASYTTGQTLQTTSVSVGNSTYTLLRWA